jgi:hypothetical protein
MRLFNVLKLSVCTYYMLQLLSLYISAQYKCVSYVPHNKVRLRYVIQYTELPALRYLSMRR